MVILLCSQLSLLLPLPLTLVFSLVVFSVPGGEEGKLAMCGAVAKVTR